MTEMEKIMEKIRKCLALAESANEHEAATAIRQARKLMDKHGLTSVGDDVFKMGRAEVGTKNSRHPKWENNLAAVVARAFQCSAFAGWKRYTFVGPAGAADVASYSFTILQRTLASAKKAAADNPDVQRLSTSRKKKFGLAFAEGWIYSVGQKVAEFARPVTGEENDSHTTYLKSAAQMKIREGRDQKSAIDQRDPASLLGLRSGIAAGEEVELHHGVGADRRPERLPGVAA